MAQPIQVKLLGQLLDEHAATLRFYAGRWSSTPEDCVQEAFVALAGQAEMPEAPVAWLYRVVRNQALNSQRADQRRSEREQAAVRLKKQSSTRQAGAGFDQADQTQLIETLQTLDAYDHELVVLRIWSGLTWAQIGELTGQSSSSAQRHYAAALKKLRNKLDSQCLTNQKTQEK